jgi:hypothetical protein
VTQTYKTALQKGSLLLNGSGPNQVISRIGDIHGPGVIQNEAGRVIELRQITRDVLPGKVGREIAAGETQVSGNPGRN